MTESLLSLLSQTSGGLQSASSGEPRLSHSAYRRREAVLQALIPLQLSPESIYSGLQLLGLAQRHYPNFLQQYHAVRRELAFPRPKTSLQKARILQLFDSGASLQAIYEEFGLLPGSRAPWRAHVRKTLKKHRAVQFLPDARGKLTIQAPEQPAVQTEIQQQEQPQ